MGKTYKRGTRWKKDRRDSNFKKSNKFKHWAGDTDHRHRPIPSDSVPLDILGDPPQDA